jgi:predicted metal-dependent HD superfamily phosphohydrolase
VELDRQRWTRLWAGLVSDRASDGSSEVFDDLTGRYAGPGRHYHNAGHIADCLRRYDDVRGEAVDPVSLELAIWFHDAVYDPRATDNEERSAQLAVDAIAGGGGGAELAGRVRRLIVATKTHDPGDEPDGPWLIDIDLAILGSPAVVFDAYEIAIRAEYGWVAPVEFCAKRAHILERFLERDGVFLTPWFRARFEAQARANLRRSLERLRRGIVPA